MNMQLQKRKGYLNLAIAALTCPCHIPIYLAILGGTAYGVFLRDNIFLIIAGLAVIFLITLTRGLKLIKEDKEQEEGSDSL